MYTQVLGKKHKWYNKVNNLIEPYLDIWTNSSQRGTKKKIKWKWTTNTGLSKKKHTGPLARRAFIKFPYTNTIH